MRPHFLPLISGLLALIGCKPDPYAPITTASGKLSQAQVDAIVANCSGPSGMARINGDRLVIHPTQRPSTTMCVLDALQATGETTLRLPSVGNQQHRVGPEPKTE